MERIAILDRRRPLKGRSGNRLDARGFSLVEMLVALVILSISILALTSIMITSIRMNQENDLRNTAVRLTSEKAEEVQMIPIENVVAGSQTRNIAMKGGKTYPYGIALAVEELTNDLKRVTITVTYNARGEGHSNTAVIYKHRAI